MHTFFDELEKQAALGTLGAMLVSAVAGKKALELKGDTARTKKLRKALEKLDPGVRVTAKNTPFGPHYMTGKKKVVVRKGEAPAILAHELGHAAVEDSTLGSLLQNRPTSIVANLSQPVHSLASAIQAWRGKSPSGIGAAIATAAMVPRTLYEAGASVHGVRKLREAGATAKEVGDAKKRLALAWSTYAGQNLAPVGDYLTYKMAPKLERAVKAL